MIEWLEPIKDFLQDAASIATIDAAMQGDPLAMMAALDLAHELGVDMHPFEVGKGVYIETLTFYWLGEVVECGPVWLKLRHCTKVFRTGRMNILLKHKSLDHKHFEGQSYKPRHEYIGNWRIKIADIIGFNDEWPLINLPKE